MQIVVIMVKNMKVKLFSVIYPLSVHSICPPIIPIKVSGSVSTLELFAAHKHTYSGSSVLFVSKVAELFLFSLPPVSLRCLEIPLSIGSGSLLNM